jgi:outer membrane biosynthesis protein TonB
MTELVKIQNLVWKGSTLSSRFGDIVLDADGIGYVSAEAAAQLSQMKNFKIIGDSQPAPAPEVAPVADPPPAPVVEVPAEPVVETAPETGPAPEPEVEPAEPIRWPATVKKATPKAPKASKAKNSKK